jgi:hypothetical protein
VVSISCAPIPMRKLYKSPHGETRHISVSPLRPGATTRADLQRELGWVEIPTGLDRLFWARYSTSNKAIGVLGPPPYIGGGRWWHDQNLIVTLDENGTLVGQESVDDTKLFSALNQVLAGISIPPPDFSPGIVVAGIPSRYLPYERLLLTPGQISIFSVSKSEPIKVSISHVRRIFVPCSFCSGESVEIEVVLKDKTSFRCDVQPKDVVTLVQWMRANSGLHGQRGS